VGSDNTFAALAEEVLAEPEGRRHVKAAADAVREGEHVRLDQLGSNPVSRESGLGLLERDRGAVEHCYARAALSVEEGVRCSPATELDHPETLERPDVALDYLPLHAPTDATGFEIQVLEVGLRSPQRIPICSLLMSAMAQRALAPKAVPITTRAIATCRRRASTSATARV